MPEPLVVRMAEPTVVMSMVDVPDELPDDPPSNGELTQKLPAAPATAPTDPSATSDESVTQHIQR